MYKIAILIGFYSYSIFLLGVFGTLSKSLLLVDSLLFLLLLFLVFKKDANKVANVVESIKKLGWHEKILITFLSLGVVVNFIGALGPELSFDSLWYHLTLPKLYIENQRVFHIPGGLLYYSDMPKLVEMLYIPALAFGNEIAAKLIHFSFGVLTLIVLYKLARKFLSQSFSILVLIVFYSNLVVGWLSITSYVDLGRTFYLVLALYYLIEHIQTKKNNALYISALMLGFAVTVKILSGVDVVVFSLLMLGLKIPIKNLIKFGLVALLVPLPWFIFSYINTGNPIYPFFSDLYPLTASLNLSNIINFVRSADPISPIYLICLPLVITLFRKASKIERVVILYCLVSFIAWLVIPQTGGGRFITAYLPAFSVVVGFCLKYSKKSYLTLVIALILLIALINTIYRGIANAKYVPVILGVESQAHFLTNNLNFTFGDFYDIDNYFQKEIKYKDRVLTIGMHNLYYVNFPFVDETWVGKSEQFNYILVQGVDLPKTYKDWHLTYENKLTHVRLYKK